jgi:predicted RNase H-like nuclease (RuvC/YqgF family)
MTTPSTRARASEKGKASPSKTTDSLVEVSQQLCAIQKDIKEVKCELKKTVKDDRIEVLVTAIVKNLLIENNKERDSIVKEKLDQKCEEIKKDYQDRIDKLKSDVEKLEERAVTLTEKLVESNTEIRNLQQKLQTTERTSKEAHRLSNQNEQYSRKNNFKIMGVAESEKERTAQIVKTFLKQNAGVEIDENEIVAAHRIPGGRGKPRPIIVKVIHNETKSMIMRKRSAVKQTGKGKLVDDVTKPNIELISALTEYEQVESAWFFNGSVFAKMNNNPRKVKFDITDDLRTKIQKNCK